MSSFAVNLPYYSERHSVPPGLTVLGSSATVRSFGTGRRREAEYDLYYIKNRSFLFDLAILIQTVEVIVFGKGAR